MNTNRNCFEVTYRGLVATVEPANGTGRWEFCYRDIGDGTDWLSLHAGNYPAVSLDEARAAMVLRCKLEHPNVLASLHRQRAELQSRITAMEAQ